MTEIKDSILEKNIDASASLLNKNVLSDKGPRIGKRHYQAMVLSLSLLISFISRTALSVAIVAMTDSTASVNKDIPTYNWTDKSLVLAAFLWGYQIPQVAAGYAANRYGGKWFLVGSMFFSSGAALLIPIAASIFGSKGVMICRFIQGISQGFLYPCVIGVLGKWIPSSERSRLGTFVFSGAPTGIVLSMLLTGYISASRFGWPFVFYLFNIVGLIISALYAYIGSSDPNDHPTISEKEKMFIKTNLNSRKSIDMQVPWKQILTSKPFLSLLCVNVSINFTHWMLLTETPIYLNKIMNVDLKSNSIISSLPYLVEVLIGFAVCFAADNLSEKHIVSTTLIRKSMNNIALVIGAVSLFLLTQIGSDNSTMVIILIILISSSHGTCKSGHLVNHMDLAPNFSGVTMGIANGVSIIISAWAPTLTQLIVKEEKNPAQWRIMFYITMFANILGCIVNTCFTSGNRQVWNEGKKRRGTGTSNDIVKAAI